MNILKRSLTTIVLGSLATLSYAYADDATTGTNYVATTSDNDNIFYKPQELSFDIFGTGSINEHTIDHLTGDRVRRNGRLGLGGGINYFFCRYVGVGADAYSINTTGSFVDYTSGNLYLRYPILQTGVAPYIFGGGGYQFDSVRQGFGQAGAGVELRLIKHVGFFVDARYVFAAETENYAIGRAGFRFSF